MKLFKTRSHAVVQTEAGFFELAGVAWDQLFQRDDLREYLTKTVSQLKPKAQGPEARDIVAPIGQQEVWAAGVTYFRSRTARMAEAQEAQGGSFYDKVYSAERPELFFKSTPHRVAGPGEDVRIRSDAKWNVPEPELTLAVSASGKIIGYTIGNDMSSRDIEGENPLYLPQAKVYDKSCALGPAILLADAPLPKDTQIVIEIKRRAAVVFTGSTTLEALKRAPLDLVAFLFRDNSFPNGCFLLTGTGIVPPDAFTLQSRDEISITIAPIGTLTNSVR
jgi:2-dehydro-3-deoxy-D-arabinonate dehydratase